MHKIQDVNVEIRLEIFPIIFAKFFSYVCVPLWLVFDFLLTLPVIFFLNTLLCHYWSFMTLSSYEHMFKLGHDRLLKFLLRNAFYILFCFMEIHTKLYYLLTTIEPWAIEILKWILNFVFIESHMVRYSECMKKVFNKML